VTSDVVDQPLVLYYDRDSCTTRAAALPTTVCEDVDSFNFLGSRFVRAGDGLVFWDYLVLPVGDIVGVVLIDFEIDPSLKRSQLLTASSNITVDGYGYYVRLAGDEADCDADGSQAFGSTLFESDAECVLILPDWHRRGYSFQLDSGLIGPIA